MDQFILIDNKYQFETAENRIAVSKTLRIIVGQTGFHLKKIELDWHTNDEILINQKHKNFILINSSHIKFLDTNGNVSYKFTLD